MFHIVLVEPEIPPNTGNVIRLAANTGCTLHLVEPLGFDLSEPKLKRAGLDYHDLASVVVHPDLDAALASSSLASSRVFAFTAKASQWYTDVAFRPGDVLLFGLDDRRGARVEDEGNGHDPPPRSSRVQHLIPPPPSSSSDRSTMIGL